MPQRPLPDPNTPEIETPVIRIQDLEHQPNADTRVNTKGMKVSPPDSPLPALELGDMEKEDAKVREAIEEFEDQYRKLPPG
jgi:hypothetical protein